LKIEEGVKYLRLPDEQSDSSTIMIPCKCRGLVLGWKPVGETSVLVRCFTDLNGIMTFRIKGGRLQYQKYGQAIDRLVLVNLEFFRTRTGTLGLKESSIIETFPSIRMNLEGILTASRIVEFYSALALPAGACSELFEEMMETLRQIEVTAGTGVRTVLAPASELQALRVSGTGSDPSICSRCGNKALPPGIFCRSDVCFICDDCGTRDDMLEKWPDQLQEKLLKLYLGELDKVNLGFEDEYFVARYIRAKYRFHFDEQVLFPALALYLHHKWRHSGAPKSVPAGFNYSEMIKNLSILSTPQKPPSA